MSTDWPVPVGESIAAPIRRALLVAGPSTSGKSTFLDQVTLGTLPEEIKAELPPGCKSWTKTNKIGFIPFFDAWPKSEKIDVAIHYDTLKAHLYGWTSFIEDPRLHAIAQADALVIVTLQPTLDQLLAQLGRKRRKRSIAARTHALERLAWKANLYRQPQFLETLSRRWDEVVAFLASNGPLSKEIRLAPTGQPYQDHDRSWTLLKVTVPPWTNTRGQAPARP